MVRLAEDGMTLTFNDCLSLCDISEAEALAIAEHQHIPPLAAVELGDYLIRTPEGELCLKAIFREHIASAAARGDVMRTLLGRADQHHRHGRVAHDLLGVAAHEEPPYAASAVRTEHDQVGAGLPGLLDDEIRCRTRKRLEQD